MRGESKFKMGLQPLQRESAFSLLPTIRKVMLQPIFLLSISWLTPTCALQVTPNSGCASICLDNPTKDVSDPNVSNTFGSDIVCIDGDYGSNAVGQKFRKCMDCLQSSTAEASGENDQGWFLYNLRFALDTCIFDTANASDPISTPCSINTVCGPLQEALQDGMSDPATMAQYSYCSADNNAFLGSYLNTCGQCLRENDDQVYMSNFLIALQAGCIQKPEAGTLIGLNSTVFTQNEVKITSPVTGTKTKHKKLSEGAIIGIVVGGVILLVIIITTIFICIRRRRNAIRLKELRSPLDPRFGALNITSPNKGAYSSPESSPSFYKESLPMKPTAKVTTSNLSRHVSQRSGDKTDFANYQNSSIGTSPSPPSYSPLNTGSGSIPIHPAYSPPHHTPPSRNSTSTLFSTITSQGQGAQPHRTLSNRSTIATNTTVGQLTQSKQRGERSEAVEQSRKTRERLYKQGLALPGLRERESPDRGGTESEGSDALW